MAKLEAIERIVNSLDLGFSDFFKGENVRQLTLEKELDILLQAVELVTIEEAMNFSIFSSKGNTHPTAEIYAIDFPSDLRASIYLLLGGYYRQAILCLRNWLEIRLTGIYFGLVNQNRKHYKEWKKGKRRAPIGRSLIRTLFSRSEFHNFRATKLRKRLTTLYEELSAFTHGAILRRYNLQSHTDNAPRFNPQSVDLWFKFALRLFRELVICYYQAYGVNAFKKAGMKSSELKMSCQLLPPSYQKILHKGKVW